jgi:hypothetical protein
MKVNPKVALTLSRLDAKTWIRGSGGYDPHNPYCGPKCFMEQYTLDHISNPTAVATGPGGYINIEWYKCKWEKEIQELACLLSPMLAADSDLTPYQRTEQVCSIIWNVNDNRAHDVDELKQIIELAYASYEGETFPLPEFGEEFSYDPVLETTF